MDGDRTLRNAGWCGISTVVPPPRLVVTADESIRHISPREKARAFANGIKAPTVKMLLLLLQVLGSPPRNDYSTVPPLTISRVHLTYEHANGTRATIPRKRSLHGSLAKNSAFFRLRLNFPDSSPFIFGCDLREEQSPAKTMHIGHVHGEMSLRHNNSTALSSVLVLYEHMATQTWPDPCFLHCLRHTYVLMPLQTPYPGAQYTNRENTSNISRYRINARALQTLPRTTPRRNQCTREEEKEEENAGRPTNTRKSTEVLSNPFHFSSVMDSWRWVLAHGRKYSRLR